MIAIEALALCATPISRRDKSPGERHSSLPLSTRQETYLSLIAIRRRRFISSLGGTLGALFFSGCAFAAGSAKIATVVWIGYGPFYVADQLDLFKKSGVKVSMQMFQDPALIPPAVTGGTVDGGLITYDQVISSVAMGEGKKFHVIYSSKDAPGMITDVLVFKGEYIKILKSKGEIKTIPKIEDTMDTAIALSLIK